jgi:O-acetylhomoserine/O-acetylserine sulfhydrylase-like pyridoxal-dependent enzyme
VGHRRDFTSAIDEKVKEIYVESIANPKYLVGDILATAEVLRFCDLWIRKFIME